MSTDPSRLSALVTHADGSTTRWGPDELDAANVAQSINFTNTSPGGFKTSSCVLPRRVDKDYRDEALLDNIAFLGPGGQVAWDGRGAAFPRDSQSVTVNGVGWSAHLEDDKTFREIYIDRQLSNWTNPPSN